MSKAQESSPCDSRSDHHYLIEVNHQKKCICQLCSCGKHRCPRQNVKGDFETTYKSNYKDTHIMIPPAPKPYVYSDRHYDLNVLKTNMKQSYKEPPMNNDLNSSRFENIGKSLMRVHVPFSGSTSYKDQYKAYQLPKYNPEDDPYVMSSDRYPKYGEMYKVKMDSSTSYRDSFQAPSPPKIQKSIQKQYKKPDVPFYGSSSYKDQFKQYAIKPAEMNQMIPQRYSTIKFDGHTSYNDQFKPYKLAEEQTRKGNKCIFEDSGIGYVPKLSSSPHYYQNQEANVA